MSLCELQERLRRLDLEVCTILYQMQDNNTSLRNIPTYTSLLPPASFMSCQGGIYNPTANSVTLTPGSTVPPSLLIFTNGGTSLAEATGSIVHAGTISIVNNNGTLSVVGEGSLTVLPGQSILNCQLPCEYAILSNTSDMEQTLVAGYLFSPGSAIQILPVQGLSDATYYFDVGGSKTYVDQYAIEYISGDITIPPHSYICATGVCNGANNSVNIKNSTTPPITLLGTNTPASINPLLPITVNLNNNNIGYITSTDGEIVYFLYNDSSSSISYVTQDGDNVTLPNPYNQINICLNVPCGYVNSVFPYSLTNISSTGTTLNGTNISDNLPANIIFAGNIGTGGEATFMYGMVSINVTYNSTNGYQYTSSKSVTIPPLTTICDYPYKM